MKRIISKADIRAPLRLTRRFVSTLMRKKPEDNSYFVRVLTPFFHLKKNLSENFVAVAHNQRKTKNDSNEKRKTEKRKKYLKKNWSNLEPFHVQQYPPTPPSTFSLACMHSCVKVSTEERGDRHTSSAGRWRVCEYPYRSSGLKILPLQNYHLLVTNPQLSDLRWRSVTS